MKRFQLQSPTGVTLSMMFIYLIQWGAQYIGYNYLPIYIDSLPFSTNSTTGLAIAVGAATTICVQPLWGRMADKGKTKNQVLCLALLLEAAAGLLFLTEMPNLWVLLLCIVLFYTPFLAPQALIDTIVVENMDKVRVRYGMVRCFASGGSALMAFIFGMIADMTNIKAFTLFSVFALGAVVPLLFLPKTRGHARQSEQKISYGKLLKNRRYLLFLTYGFALFLCSSMINAFFPIFVTTDKGLNAGTEWYGIFMGITILLETSVMFFGAKLFAKLNAYAVFLLPPLAGIFRVLFIVFANAPSDLYFYPIFHALWFGPLWAKVAPFIQSVVPQEMRATGQSVWIIVTCGIAPVIGSLGAGVLSDVFGMRQMFGVICAILVAMTVLFAVLFFHQYRLDQREACIPAQEMPTAE